MFQFVRRTPSKSRDCARARNAFDVGVYSLDEIVQFPPLQLGAGAVGGPTVQTATQQAAWRAWVVEADNVCFGAVTRAAAVKVRAHSPATVMTHVVLSSKLSA